MIRKISLIIFAVLVGLGVYHRQLLDYAWAQARGQLHILWNVREVKTVLADPAFPDSLKTRIRLIEEIKKFGVDSLGLNPSDNYTSFYDQGGKPILWVITASEKYKIKAREWRFPVIGKFSYKGFFDPKRADEEQSALDKEGWDTDRSEVSAWSTLGYLRDPILSSMLSRSEGSLAGLILHELTHGTLFVKNNLELNENLASFIGDYGAIRFLEHKYGTDSPQLRKYLLAKKYNDAWAEHMLRGSKRLDSLYSTMLVTQEVSLKDSLKSRMIQRIMGDADTLLSGKYSAMKSARKVEMPNNAYFIGFHTYRSKQNVFRAEFETKFNRNFSEYFKFLKGKYPSL